MDYNVLALIFFMSTHAGTADPKYQPALDKCYEASYGQSDIKHFVDQGNSFVTAEANKRVPKPIMYVATTAYVIGKTKEVKFSTNKVTPFIPGSSVSGGFNYASQTTTLGISIPF